MYAAECEHISKFGTVTCNWRFLLDYFFLANLGTGWTKLALGL